MIGMEGGLNQVVWMVERSGGGVVGWLDRSGGWSGVARWPKGREGQLAWFTLHINEMIQLIK